MNKLRKAVGFLMVLLLAGFALPAVAADKLFKVYPTTFLVTSTTVTNIGSVIPTSVPAGTRVILLLDYSNKSPNTANSVIKSINAVVPPYVKYGFAGSSSVNVSNSNPSVRCADPSTTYSTVVPSFGGGAATSTYTKNNITGVKPDGHFCLYLAVSTTSESCSAVPWTLNANTGNSISGGTAFSDYDKFVNDGIEQPYTSASTTNGCTGILGCETTNNTAGNLDATQDLSYVGASQDWGLVRSQTNKNLVSCAKAVPFNFVFTPSPAGEQTAYFTIPDTLGEQPAIEYVVRWSPVPVNTASGNHTGWSTTPTERPHVSFIKDAAGNFTEFVPALRCVVDALPTSTIPSDPGYLADTDILPVIPNEAPFNTYNGHALYDGYSPHNLAKMCVAAMGGTSVGRESGGEERILIQYWHKFIDYVDGGSRLPN